MKRQFLLWAVLCLAAAQAWGQEVVDSGTCGAEGDGSNLTWTLTDDGTLTISGEGAMMLGWTYGNQPWYDCQSGINTIIIADGVTSIGGLCFL